ncbi:coronin-1C-like isoform X3 [Branchiostoma floridae x Branchiostoma japonicum]
MADQYVYAPETPSAQPVEYYYYVDDQEGVPIVVMEGEDGYYYVTKPPEAERPRPPTPPPRTFRPSQSPSRSRPNTPTLPYASRSRPNTPTAALTPRSRPNTPRSRPGTPRRRTISGVEPFIEQRSQVFGESRSYGFNHVEPPVPRSQYNVEPRSYADPMPPSRVERRLAEVQRRFSEGQNEYKRSKPKARRVPRRRSLASEDGPMSFRGLRTSKFRHVFGTAMRKDSHYEGIRVTRNSWDSTFCAVNPKFLAIVTEAAGGGCFLVLPIEKAGRVPNNPPMVAGHRAAVLDIQWSPFDDTIIASCSEDMTIKVWVIPEKGLEESITEPEASLESVHQRRVGFIAWHPSAHNILMSAGSDNFVVIWNVGTEEPLSLIECHTDILWSCGWNYNGTRIVTTCKDKTLRVIDPRTGDVISERKKAHDGAKPQRAVYLKDGRVFTTGFSRMSERQYALWDDNNLSEPITLEEIDTSNGVIFPFYDPDNNMVYLGGKGDSNIRYYEVTEQSPYVHYIDRFDTSDPQRGLGFMPKRGVNALQNEIARFYKLHPNKCEPISFTVPRKSELFQEDLYPDTASQVPALSADEWIEGKNADPNLMSIRDEFASVLPAKPKLAGLKKPNALNRPKLAPSKPTSTNSVRDSAPPKPAPEPTPPPPKVERSPPARERERSPPREVHRGSGDRTSVAATAQKLQQQHNAYERQEVHAREEEKVEEGAGAKDPPPEPPKPEPEPEPEPAAPRQQPAAPQPQIPPDFDFQELLEEVKGLRALVRQHERRIMNLEDALGIGD